MCYYCNATFVLPYPYYPWPVFIQQNDLNTGLFLRTCLGVGIYKKGPYYTECGEMIDGCW